MANIPPAPPARGESLELSREQVASFLHHLHWIPANKGLLTQWLDENVTGWGSHELRVALSKAGAIEPCSQHFSGYRPVVGLRWVRLTSDGSCSGISIDP